VADLRNSGLVLVGDQDAPGQRAGAARTLIVVGVARSGTTMVATVLHCLGVHLGDQVGLDVYEDLEAAAVLEQDEPALRSLIARKNREHRVWGFKRPEAFRTLDPARMDLFRAPHVLATFRDPVAIAERNRISMHEDFLAALRRAARSTRQLVRWTALLRCPVLMISYEKAMSSPERFVDAVIAFCGLTPTPEQRRAAIASVESGPSSYLIGSRIEAVSH
jgi:hypothetical protein